MVAKRVRQTIIVLAFAAGSLSLAACGGGNQRTADGETPADTSAEKTTAAAGTQLVTIELNEENGSRQTGTATLKPAGKTFDVELEVTPPKKFDGDFQHAHVHDVTCAEYRKLEDFNAQLGTVVDQLSDLSRGKSSSDRLGNPRRPRNRLVFDQRPRARRPVHGRRVQRHPEAERFLDGARPAFSPRGRSYIRLTSSEARRARHLAQDEARQRERGQQD